MFKKVYYGWGGKPETENYGQNDMTKTRDGLHERTYMVQCWVHPSSGKDLAEQNRMMSEFKHFMSNVFYNDSAVDDGLEQFEKEFNGLVLRPFFMKSFYAVDNPEEEFLSQIRLENPEAKFASCQEVPNSR